MNRTEEGPLNKSLEALVVVHIDCDEEGCRGVEEETE